MGAEEHKRQAAPWCGDTTQGKPRSLRQQAVSGITWTGASMAITTCLHFLRLAVLARLLGPEDFGLMAMVLVIATFAQVMTNVGLGEAIIHRQDVTREHLSTLYWLNVAAGLISFVVLWAAIPLIVSVYHEPRLADIIFWVAITFPIASLGHQFAVLLRKELRFKGLSQIEVASDAVNFTVAVAAAVAGAGVFALVWGLLASVGARSLLLVSVGVGEWRPMLHFCRRDMRGYLGFGLYRVGAMMANLVGLRLGQFLVGVILGAQAAGYYYLAYNLALQPMSHINPILEKVAFPLFAKMQNDAERLRRSFFLQLRVVAVVISPLLLGLAAVAPVMVPTILGERWIPAIPLIQVLALVGLLRSINNPLGGLMMAKGRADLSFQWNVGVLVTLVPAMVMGAHLGDGLGVALVWLVMQFAYLIASYLILTKRLLGRCLREYLMSIAPWATAGLVMAVAIVGVSLAFGREEGLHWLLGLVSLGAVIYSGVIALFAKGQILELVALLRSRRQAPKPTEVPS